MSDPEDFFSDDEEREEAVQSRTDHPAASAVTSTKRPGEEEAEDAKSDGESEPGALDESDHGERGKAGDRPNGRGGYDDDEEDEDEEEEGGPSRRYDDDEDEEEEEEDEDLPKARKKRRKVNRFIDEEAMVDDDEEEEEDEEEGFVEGQDEDFDELARETLDSRAHRELDRRRDEDSMDAEALAATMKARYGRSEFSRGAYRGDVEHIPQSMLMPSVADPKLWLCQVREGREKDVVFTILRKAIDRESTAGALDIYSVFARDSLKGYIYIEARQQAAVQAALDGVNNVFISKLRLVPVDEMVDCLTIKAKDQNLDNVHWFRVKRGKYAGDLGQVIQITENGETMLCRLVPRLEIGREGVRGPGAQKRKKNEPRAPQKLFNPMDHKGEVRKDRDYYIYNNEYFDREGYLEKNLKVSSVETVNVNPSLEEIGMFSGGTADKADLTHVANLAATRVATDYHIGEPVKITAGAMMGITGVVASIQHDILGIKPDSAYGSTLPSIVRVAASEVQKTFNVGDSVKVVKGKHEGAGGLIVVIDDNIITILDEGTKETIEVLSDYVRTTTDVGVIQPRTSPYDVGDLVFLQNDVAVVTKAERDQIFVLTQFGQTLRVQAQQIRSKRDSRSAIANDANRNPISAGTTVDVLDSDGRGDAKYTGTVQHIYRAFVFVKVVDLVENGGFVVAKAQNVVDKNAGKNGNSYSSPYDSYQTRNSFGGGGNRGGMGGFGGRGGGGGGGRGRGGGRGNFDPLIGQTVTIATGTFKGYLGIVKEVIDNQARVELHTASRVVTVDKTKVLRPGETRLPGAAGGRSDNPWGPPSSSISSYGDKWTSSASKTPMHGSKTPMHGSRTPFHGIGGRTPAHGDGGRTPGWDSGRASGSGSNTVDLGSRSTAAWDAGSKTPGHGMSAWDAGSRTPGHRAYGLDLDEPDNDGYGNSYDRRPYGDDKPVTSASSTLSPKPTPASTIPSPKAAPAQAVAAATTTRTSEKQPDRDTPTHATVRSDPWPLPNLLVQLTTDATKHFLITSTTPSARTATLHPTLSTSADSTTTDLDRSAAPLSISYDSIRPVPPGMPGQRVVILRGDAQGKVGRLISMEEGAASSDAIVVLDGNKKDMKILDLKNVGLVRDDGEDGQ